MAPRNAFCLAELAVREPECSCCRARAWRPGGTPGAGLQRTAPKGCRTGKYRGRRAGPEAVRCPIMGKLATVANRIVDRGELCACPVKERRCQNTLPS